MYISYEKIGKIFTQIFNNNVIKTFFYNKKVAQNLEYIKRNKPTVIKKIQNKLKNKNRVNIVFYVYDLTKWKCQSVYEEFLKDGRFDVKILVTKSSAENFDNPSYQSIEDVKRCYEFFVSKKMSVELAYDVEKKEFVPFEKFNPDIIFYQHPWYVETTQGPVVCSKFALTAYIPYYFPIETDKVDYYLRFHQYVQNYYILDEYTKEKYGYKMDNGGANLKVVGYPHLDYFLSNQESDEGYIIYAPHWTVAEKGLAYSTFEWSGKFLLEYAKKSGKKWIFKPHPLLNKALIDNNIMSKDEVEDYYKSWDEIGIRYEGGDYLELFNKSSMMITDSSSFLGEYFITGKPLIHLLSKKSQFQKSENPILKCHYRVESLNELKYVLEKLPYDDYKKTCRLELLEKMDLNKKPASRRILEDILNQIV